MPHAQFPNDCIFEKQSAVVQKQLLPSILASEATSKYKLLEIIAMMWKTGSFGNYVVVIL